MADNAALRVAANAGPSAGSQAAAGEAAPAKAQGPAKRAAAGEAAPADGQPPAKRAKQATAPAAAVTLPSSAEAKAALLQQLEAEVGQLVKDAADMTSLAALPAALSDVQRAKGLVKAEVGFAGLERLAERHISCTGGCGGSTSCKRQLNLGPDEKDCTGVCLGAGLPHQEQMCREFAQA